MDLMAETLRLELAPFGVKTVSLITGAVETRALAFFNTWSLPPASRYKPIEPVITARVRGVETFLQIPITEYADQVADKLIKGTSGRVWTGVNSTLMWLLVNYVPGWIQVCSYMLSSSKIADLCRIECCSFGQGWAGSIRTESNHADTISGGRNNDITRFHTIRIASPLLLPP